MENLAYESRPYVYMTIAAWTFFRMTDSKLALVSGVALLICGIYVLHIRGQARQELAKSKNSSKR